MTRPRGLTTQQTVLGSVAMGCMTMVLSVMTIAGEGDAAAAIVVILVLVLLGWSQWA